MRVAIARETPLDVHRRIESDIVTPLTDIRRVG
jgi:hypothetical protein